MILILKKNESLIGGLRRIASEIILESIFLLKNPTDMDYSIHESRKNIKKLRAILRLIKKNINFQDFAYFNIEFRDNGKKLSDIRDAEALIEALVKIKPRKFSLKKTIENTKIKLILNKEQISSSLTTNYIQIIIDNLEILEKKFFFLEFTGSEDSIFTFGLQNLYSNCISLMEICINEGTDNDFHEWRKQVKYLWNSIMFFQKIWNPVLTTYSNEIHKLSDYLGDLHDLSVLSEMIINHQVELEAEDKERMLEIINNRKTRLKKSAFQQGFKLFIDKPSVFSKRLNKWWNHYSTVKT